MLFFLHLTSQAVNFKKAISTLSLSTFRRQLTRFCFSHYWHTERVRGYFTVRSELNRYINYLHIHLLSNIGDTVVTRQHFVASVDDT